jgi:DedD protein
MEEKNELNDIILNKGSSAANNKKIILAVATLGVVLIIVVLLMNSISSDNNENLPQAVLPPDPREIKQENVEEPLFEEVEVIEDNTKTNNLDNIAQRLKEESEQEVAVPVVPKPKPQPKPVYVEKSKESKPSVSYKQSSTGEKLYYAQVGSFSKYEPNKKFLKSITDKGFAYTYKKVGTLNKVLIGPFDNQKEAREVLADLVVKDHLDYIITPMFNKFAHVLHSVQGVLAKRKNPVDTAMEIYKDDGQLLVKLKVINILQ